MNKKRKPLSEITQGDPVDKTAALVTSQRKIGPRPETKDGQPLPIYRPDLGRIHTHEQLPVFMRLPETVTEDFTGRRFDYLTVIGILDKITLAAMIEARGEDTGKLSLLGQAHVNRWVVKCSCGQYEIRKPKTLNAYRGHVQGPSREHACLACNREFRADHGPKPD